MNLFKRIFKGAGLISSGYFRYSRQLNENQPEAPSYSSPTPLRSYVVSRSRSRRRTSRCNEKISESPSTKKHLYWHSTPEQTPTHSPSPRTRNRNNRNKSNRNVNNEVVASDNKPSPHPSDDDIFHDPSMPITSNNTSYSHTTETNSFSPEEKSYIREKSVCSTSRASQLIKKRPPSITNYNKLYSAGRFSQFESTQKLSNVINVDNDKCLGIICYSTQSGSRGFIFHKAKIKIIDLKEKYLCDDMADIINIKQQQIRKEWEDKNDPLPQRSDYKMVGTFPNYIIKYAHSQKENKHIDTLPDHIQNILDSTIDGTLSHEDFLLENAKTLINESRNPVKKAREIGIQIREINEAKLINKGIRKQFKKNKKPWMDEIIQMAEQHENIVHHFCNEEEREFEALSEQETDIKNRALRGAVFIYSTAGNTRKTFFYYILCFWYKNYYFFFLHFFRFYLLCDT